MPCGVGGLLTGAGLVDRAVNQGPWLQERVGGGRRGWSFKEGGGLGPNTKKEAPRPTPRP